ncbi:MAG: CRISPR-associated protein [Pauljensenia sp.]
MSAESTTSNNTPKSGHVTIVFTSDWGVSTGVGRAGRTHSTIERGSDGQPVVRGTVITGVLREQAFIAARALDTAAGTPDASGSRDASGAPDIPKGPWESFAEWLFGQHPDLSPSQHPHPRHVVFTDASPIAYLPVHDTVSLSIDPTTGTARDQFLRFTERAAPGVLTGTFTLIDEAGAELSDPATIKAARFLLGVAGLMVRGIGSGRSGGDGECTVAIADRDNLADGQLDGEAAEALARIKKSVAREGDDSSQEFTYTTADVESVAKAVRGLVRGELPKNPPQPRDSKKRERLEVTMPSGDGDEAGATTWYEATLDIVLDSPVVSYEVPFSNEVRSLDFLRGTVLVPWLHGLLRRKFSDEDLVGSAIVSGDLRIGDALPVYRDAPGLPIPFVFEEEKVPEDAHPEDESSKEKPCTLFNRHLPIALQECGRNTVPTRNRYVFLTISTDESDTHDGANVSAKGWVGKPALIGRESTAIDSSKGAAKDGSLFLVRALPAGLRLRCSVVVSERLLAVLQPTVAGEDTFSSDSAQTVRLDLGITEEKALLGSRKLTGTFGRARCTLSEDFRHVGSTPCLVQGPAKSDDVSLSSRDLIEVSLWFTSDVLARSSALGPGGTVKDLELAFRRAGISLQAVQESSGGDSRLPCPEQDEEPCPSGTDDCPPHRNRKHIVTAIRHRRVDSWSTADNAPRATRLAIQAGSVIRVRVASEQLNTLKTLGHVGVGELTPQGYGRFKVDSHALSRPKLPLIKTVSKCFTDNESEVCQ